MPSHAHDPRQPHRYRLLPQRHHRTSTARRARTPSPGASSCTGIRYHNLGVFVYNRGSLVRPNRTGEPRSSAKMPIAQSRKNAILASLSRNRGSPILKSVHQSQNTALWRTIVVGRGKMVGRMMPRVAPIGRRFWIGAAPRGIPVPGVTRTSILWVTTSIAIGPSSQRRLSLYRLPLRRV
jgi:hypothetical protein